MRCLGAGNCVGLTRGVIDIWLLNAMLLVEATAAATADDDDDAVVAAMTSGGN